MSFRWGIIGAGGIAATFAKDLEGSHHEILSVGSRSLERARTFGFGRRFYGSYEELVSDPDVDAIYVASPHSHHYEHTLLALEAGKPALVEKSFTLNAAQAQELISTARQKNLALMEAMWTRFLPHIQQIHHAVTRGEIGQIVSISAHHGQNISRQRAERLWNPDLGGGALLDLGIYPISLAYLFLGKPDLITALSTLSDEKVDTQTSAIFYYRNGAHAQLDCTMLAATSNVATISGTEGRIEISAPFFAPVDYTIIRGDHRQKNSSTYRHGGWREEAFEFERLVRTGVNESPSMSLDETLAIMETMDEIRRQTGISYRADQW